MLNLGSSNYITNIAGEVSQHTEYFAFGETFVEEHKGSNNSPYKFNGKELDNESGLYYYGARYYDPRISIWASTDPLAEAQPGKSPYQYCSSNPINRTDPTGMIDGEYEVSTDSKGKKSASKVSNLGDDTNTDYIHYKGGKKDGKTEIINKNTGDKMMMKSSKFIKDYVHRYSEIRWSDIYHEFVTGKGPENSLVTGTETNMIQMIMRSPQFAKAFNAFLKNGGNKKFQFTGDFGVSGALDAGKNMTAQMIGKANFSFYPVGDQLVIMVADTKSYSSYSFNPLVKFISNFSDCQDTPRTGGEEIPESTTNQTYLWVLPIKK